MYEDFAEVVESSGLKAVKSLSFSGAFWEIHGKYSVAKISPKTATKGSVLRAIKEAKGDKVRY